MLYIIILLTLALGLLIGVTGYIWLPFATNSKLIGNVYGWLAMLAVRQATFFHQANSNLKFRKLKQDSSGALRAKIKGEKASFTDPANAAKRFFGRPLVFTDELHNYCYRLSDAAFGRQVVKLQQQDKMLVPASKKQRKKHRIVAYVRSAIRARAGPISLQYVRALATGNERAFDGTYAKEWWKFSRPSQDEMIGYIRLFSPILSSLLVILVLSLVSSNGGGTPAASAGGGNNTTTLSILAFSVGINLQNHIKKIAGSIVILGIGVGLYLYNIIALYLAIVFVLGIVLGLVLVFVFMVITAFAKRPASLAKTHMDFCLEFYENAKIVELADKYKLVESNDRSDTLHRYGRHWLELEPSKEAFTSRDDFMGAAEEMEYDSEYSVKNTIAHCGLWHPTYEPGIYCGISGVLGSLAEGGNGEATDSIIQKTKKDEGGPMSGPSSRFLLAANFFAMAIAFGFGFLMFF